MDECGDNLFFLEVRCSGTLVVESSIFCCSHSPPGIMENVGTQVPLYGIAHNKASGTVQEQERIPTRVIIVGCATIISPRGGLITFRRSGRRRMTRRRILGKHPSSSTSLLLSVSSIKKETPTVSPSSISATSYHLPRNVPNIPAP